MSRIPLLLCTVIGLLAVPHSVQAVAVTPPTAVAKNWVAIAKHIQNPQLYEAHWADKVDIGQADEDDDNDDDDKGDDIKSGQRLVTKCKVTRGEILSLVPVERLHIQYDNDGNHAPPTSSSPMFSFSSKLTRPHEYHRTSGLAADTRLVVQAPLRTTVPCTPGWMGHLADSSGSTVYNCRVVPLLGAMPLCALVATTDIPANKTLVAAEPDNKDEALVEDLALQVLKRYIAEIAELRSYTSMAHPFPEYYQRPVVLPAPRFHAIDKAYPGMRALHQDPDVYQIADFLTPQECQAIIEYAKPRLVPCLIKNADTGRVEVDPTRTSTNANIPQSALPTVTAKVCQLLQAPSPQHLEIFQVLRYTPGQVFLPHTDGFDGPIPSACGFEHSGRLVTLFCYLHSCPAGGETRFPQLDNLVVAPVQGQAVVHFPNTIDLQQDQRTEHESCPVVEGEKWLFVTWCWKHARSDPAYHEALIVA